ncbi:winged helix-turn-helix transcriptional regulator [Streptomyces sp. 5-8]|uniref:Winged helix-turn-helix transcriptional regulator n=2 Tax=Streptomyces TaxID=1883 RepID=A0ABS1NW40_9ACTN|nr:MarR family winged helix-turn-helix transcriptional regulator [Streptomyces musisoli]MBL1104318.1 winged helix-turn-helix transcriptional regulator [Streptomyces musisoli]
MTRLGGPGGDRTSEGEGAEAAALAIADALESLTTLWSLAAQEATLRLSLHQLRALRALEGAPGLNLTALAERLDIGLPTASRLCDRLEAAGLLERVLHPHKRREVQLNLTAQARRVLDDVARRRTRALAAVLEHMGPADRAALSRGLEAFRAALDERPPGPAAAGRDPASATEDDGRE